MPTPAQEVEFQSVYEEWSQGLLTQATAAARLGMAARTFRRHVAGFRLHGSRWWKDRSGHRRSHRRAPDGERAKLETRYLDQYSGWNVRHFYEKYRSEHGGTRSYSWVKEVLQTAGLVEKRVRNGGPDRPGQDEQREPIPRSPREGMLLHQVASRNEWVTGRDLDLVILVDDATDRVYSGSLVEDRGIWSIFAGIRATLERGLFDRLSVGLAVPVRLSVRETAFGGRTRPQLERAMSELDIEVTWQESQFRMRTARLFRTLLGRVPRELAREGITEVGQANDFLARFWATFNEFKTTKPSDPSDAFVALGPRLQTNARQQVSCLKHEAEVCTGHRLLCKGKQLDIRRLKCPHLCLGKHYRIHEYEDGRCELFHRYDSAATFVANDVGLRSV